MQNSAINQNLLYGVIGLVLGILITGQVANNNMGSMMRMMGMGRAHSMMNEEAMGHEEGSSMSTSTLSTKRDDDFDKAFISEMIVHHEGAVALANLAKQYAKHDEIKKMADDIISAQTREIDVMRQWNKDWYGTDVDTKSDDIMSHR